VRRRGDAGACRIAYDRDGCTALDREHWEDYIDWFIETGVRRPDGAQTDTTGDAPVRSPGIAHDIVAHATDLVERHVRGERIEADLRPSRPSGEREDPDLPVAPVQPSRERNARDAPPLPGPYRATHQAQIVVTAIDLPDRRAPRPSGRGHDFR